MYDLFEQGSEFLGGSTAERLNRLTGPPISSHSDLQCLFPFFVSFVPAYYHSSAIMDNIVPSIAPMPTLSIASLVLLSFLVWYIQRLIYNIYFHRLAKFPGPKLAAASRWYEGYYDNLVADGGQYMYKVDRLHEEYGCVQTPAIPAPPDSPGLPLAQDLLFVSHQMSCISETLNFPPHCTRLG